MEHTKFIENISLWLDDELNPSEIRALRVHLADCTTCQETYQALQQVDNFFRQAATTLSEPAPGFIARFETRLAQPQPRFTWRAWVGVTILLVSSLAILTIGMVIGGITLLSLWATIIDTTIFYYWLGQFGSLVNQARLFVNFGGALVKLLWLASQQPVFWGIIPAAVGLSWLWTRLMKAPIQQLPQTAKMLL